MIIIMIVIMIGAGLSSELSSRVLRSQSEGRKPTWKGQIDGSALASPRSNFSQSTCAWIAARLVRAHEKNGGVIVEDVMRPVAVMDIEVEDHHLRTGSSISELQLSQIFESLSLSLSLCPCRDVLMFYIYIHPGQLTLNNVCSSSGCKV